MVALISVCERDQGHLPIHFFPHPGQPDDIASDANWPFRYLKGNLCADTVFSGRKISLSEEHMLGT